MASRAPWAVLGKLRQRALDDAASLFARRATESEQASERLVSRQQRVEAEQQDRQQTQCAELERGQAGLARISDLQRLQDYRVGSEQRQRQLDAQAERARDDLQRAVEARERAQAELADARAQLQAVRRVEQAEQDKANARAELILDEEANERWVSSRRM